MYFDPENDIHYDYKSGACYWWNPETNQWEDYTYCYTKFYSALLRQFCALTECSKSIFQRFLCPTDVARGTQDDAPSEDSMHGKLSLIKNSSNPRAENNALFANGD